MILDDFLKRRKGILPTAHDARRLLEDELGNVNAAPRLLFPRPIGPPVRVDRLLLKQIEQLLQDILFYAAIPTVIALSGFSATVGVLLRLGLTTRRHCINVLRP